MEARYLVLKAKEELVNISQDEHFKEQVNALNTVIATDQLVNYVMNKLLKKAREEGGNVFYGDSNMLNEFITEFYIDYETLGEKDMLDNWSRYIRMPEAPKAKKGNAEDVEEEEEETEEQVEAKPKKKAKPKAEKKEEPEQQGFTQMSLFDL